MSCSLSTHVLDTGAGKPAVGVTVGDTDLTASAASAALAAAG